MEFGFSLQPAEGVSSESFSSASWPILACSPLRSIGGCPFVGVSPKTAAARSRSCTVLPVGDLVGVDVELLGELCQRLVAADGGERNSRLERLGMVTWGPSAHSLLRFLGPPARSAGAEFSHLSRCPDFRGRLCDGHNLETLLRNTDEKGFAALVTLTEAQRAAIRHASTYYEGKVFEYPAIGETLCAYPGMPALDVLYETAAILVNSLRELCREAE